MSTTLASTSFAAAFVTTFTSLVRAAAERTGLVAKIMVNRWMAKQLCDFTDHELADIGLSRFDVREALGGPLYADPSLRLAAVAHGNSVKMNSVVLHRVKSVDFTPLVRGREE